MHGTNIHGQSHGNGKRWLLIGLFILGGFWLVNDAYDDGFRDAMIQSGQTTGIRRYHDGPDFPWGLVILGGIGYVAWRKGAFDRFGGPGGPFNGSNGQRGLQPYGASGPAYGSSSPSPGYGGGPTFRGPRAFFDDWHRQAHESASRAEYSTPPAPPTQPASPAGSPGPVGDNGSPQGGFAPTPPPTPPTPEYWASMPGADAGSSQSTPVTQPITPEAAQGGSPVDPRGTTGTQV